MNYTPLDFLPALPEIFVLVMICVTLLTEVFLKQGNKVVVYALAQITLLGAALLTLILYPQLPLKAFSGSFILDNLALVLKIAIYLISFVALLYSRPYIEERKIPTGEYYLLSLFVVLGMSVLVSAHSLLTLYLGLEILSLPLYAMVAIDRDSAMRSEAAIKYFILGALASGILLYGMSMFYGVSQSLDISTIAQVIANDTIPHHMILMIGLVFIVVGVVFKFGAVPFHLWVPDVYQGAPTSVTILISSAPKIAAFGLALRLLVQAMPALTLQWQELLILVAVLSMLLGNMVAIAQKNLKRMLGYSAIAHIGYLSLGLIAATPAGYAAALFYTLNYAMMSLGAFGMIALLSQNGFEAELVDDFRGLNSRNPWLAFMMMLLMFSMAGIPPTVGFFAKMGVLIALISSHFVWLAVLALLAAVIGAYYYLYMVKVMYFEAPPL